jgi:predicted NAD/FAD-binding protein
MRIAVIGAGISGLTTAYLLRREHQVSVFEKADHIGGHTLTLDVERDGRNYRVDTGFVVYNTATYPNFVRLLEGLGVESQPTEMSFSVRCDATGLEYCGTSINTLFAQRRNIVNAGFWGLLLDILRFNRVAGREAGNGGGAGTLGEFLSRNVPSERLRRHYLIPMVAAIWSLDPARVGDLPASFFLRFMTRHRLLQVRNTLQWRAIRGGSRTYVDRLVDTIPDGVQVGTCLRSVRRSGNGVEVQLEDGSALNFDHVVMAVHSDQALRLLADPTDAERDILGAFEYQPNDVVVHTDVSLLPRNRRAWANWNYRVKRNGADRPATTYNMSGLQGLDSPEPFCVTLNDTDSIDPATIIDRRWVSHPVFTTAAVDAQKKKERISGVGRTHYCGAYWGFGFHEDGVASGLDVCRKFGLEL